MLEGKHSLRREGCSGAGCRFCSEFRGLLRSADLGDLLTFSRGFWRNVQTGRKQDLRGLAVFM